MRRARAVELEEERRRERLRRKAVDARVVGVEGRERRRVQQLAARDGHAVEPQALDGLDGGRERFEAHRRRGDVRRRRVQRERDLRDDAERALGPDEEPREVVARRGLARAAARLQDLGRKESEIPNFKGSDLGRLPLVSADFWTSDHLSERSRSVGAVSETCARGTLTLKRR